MKSLFRASILAGIPGLPFAIAVLASLSFCAPAVQAKGKPDKPGGGGEDPVEVPFHYQVTWHQPTGEDDRLSLRDVTPDGTVVGVFWPGNVYNNQIAIIRIPGLPEVNLENLLIDAGELPADWRVAWASRICDGLLVGVDVFDPDGRLYCGAIKLNPDGTLKWFELFDAPEGEDSLLRDATESGDFLIATGDGIAASISGFYFGDPATLSVWNPSTDTTVTLPGPVQGGQPGWYDNSSISAYMGGTALVIDSLYHFIAPGVTPLLDPGTTFSTFDVGADGTVLAKIDGIAGTHHKRNPGTPDVLVRWVPDALEWEPIVNLLPSQFNSDSHPFVNGSGEIAGNTDGELFIFHDDYDLQSVDNMIQPSQASQWDSGAGHLLFGFSDPIPVAPYSGVILGTYGGSYFTLTPVPVPVPEP